MRSPLFASAQVDDAAREYEAIVASGPHSQFAPRALLFQAARIALGERGKRDRLLEQLAAEDPASPAARGGPPSSPA